MTMNNELKTKYKTDFATLTKLVNSFDPLPGASLVAKPCVLAMLVP